MAVICESRVAEFVFSGKRARDSCAEEGATDLGADIHEHLGEAQHPSAVNCDRHRRIVVCSTDVSAGKDHRDQDSTDGERSVRIVCSRHPNGECKHECANHLRQHFGPNRGEDERVGLCSRRLECRRRRWSRRRTDV